jgi:hypothetical protein
MKHSRLIAMKAALFAVMALPMLLAPVYAQQEVDPTWYNPWPDAAKTAMKPAQTKTADSKTRNLTTASTQHPKIRDVKATMQGKKPAAVTQAMLGTK